MPAGLELSAQLEDYLEVIARLIRESGHAHVRDIAARLLVHKSTVTAALRKLAEKQLVHYSAYRPATLTEHGQRLAEEVTRRHAVIRRFLTDVLLLDRDTAERNACQLEHAIDKVAFDRLLNFADFVQYCPRGGESWIHGFEQFCQDGQHTEQCDRCLELCLEDLKAARQDTPSIGDEHNMLTLADIKPGSEAMITRIQRSGPVTRRLVDMGVVRGTPVKVIKVAPLGDPIEIKVKGYNLSLRKEEASHVSVSLETTEPQSGAPPA